MPGGRGRRQRTPRVGEQCYWGSLAAALAAPTADEDHDREVFGIPGLADCLRSESLIGFLRNQGWKIPTTDA